MSKTVVSAVLGVSLLLGCAKGDGKFVGKEEDPRKGVACSLCTVDPPPLQVDCLKEEEGTEFLPVKMWTFDQEKATNLYTYNDASGLFSATARSWEPDTEAGDWCVGRTGNKVLHYQAGPFTNWGGAIGRHFKCLNGSSVHGEMKIGAEALNFSSIGCSGTMDDSLLACTPRGANATPDELLAWSVCPERDKQALAGQDGGDANPEEYLLGMSLDLSAWDGISFWARRSSDSQAGIRVSIGDKFTDDDMSYMQYHINPDDKRACERNIECGCNGNSKCYPKLVSEYLGRPPGATEVPEERCWDLPPALHLTSSMADTDPLLPPECGQRMCTVEMTGNPRIFDALQHEDVQRAGTTCQEYRFNGGIEGLFCYKPDGLQPQENSQLCGDHWTYPVYLSTEWKFYKVPFTSLLQQGWAKKFDKLDVSTATMIRFQWSTGWMDFWLDDVRVYRDKLNTGKR